jgi:hypothetical protein
MLDRGADDPHPAAQRSDDCVHAPERIAILVNGAVLGEPRLKSLENADLTSDLPDQSRPVR